MPHVEVSGRHVSYELNRSVRARWPRLEIRLHRGVRVVLPEAAPEAEAERLIRSKSGWLLRALARFDRLQKIVPDRRLASGERLPLLDETLALEVSRGLKSVERRGDVLAAPAARTRAALEEWYVARAEDEFERRVRDAAARHRIAIRGVGVSRGRSRWGTCSPTGRILLNWRLMLGPSSNLDYLVAHELAHVDHPNHSATFWSRVGKLHPGYRESERWLRKYGAGLVL